MRRGRGARLPVDRHAQSKRASTSCSSSACMEADVCRISPITETAAKSLQNARCAHREKHRRGQSIPRFVGASGLTNYRSRLVGYLTIRETISSEMGCSASPMVSQETAPELLGRDVPGGAKLGVSRSHNERSWPMRRSGRRGGFVERAGSRPIEQEETHGDLFCLGGNRIRN